MTHRQTDRHTDRQTYRQTYIQTDRHIDRHIDRHTDKVIHRGAPLLKTEIYIIKYNFIEFKFVTNLYLTKYIMSSRYNESFLLISRSKRQVDKISVPYSRFTAINQEFKIDK